MPDDPSSEITVARTLMRDAAALATLQEGGAPFASYAITAPAANGEPLLLLSRLAVHTRNIARDSRASLLFVAPAAERADATTARLTLVGSLRRDDDPAARRSYLDGQPAAASYAGFSDFAIYRFEIEFAHLVAGFGRIRTLSRADLLPAEDGGG
jgi:putative heme iron utilization protein